MSRRSETRSPTAELAPLGEHSVAPLGDHQMDSLGRSPTSCPDPKLQRAGHLSPSPFHGQSFLPEFISKEGFLYPDQGRRGSLRNI